MITLKNVNKYYNRHKKNELHVIDNTSLELESTGLVALLGPSGCGKTTLLNAIGGLDKVQSGEIFIDGKKLPKRGNAKKDEMRVLNIGYIFQDYNLLDHLSVFENVAISLKMIGVKNKDEIKKRVNYILDLTGMYRFRNKLAGNLSGGQRQRVGIARALVKNPKIIIADEPTGNLDSKNTIEVMNIIKTISKERLVILVTHESDLAKFYASRIVSLEDGHVIKDVENIHDDELDYRIDNKIYLKEFKNVDHLKKGTSKIDIYSSEKENLDLSIVVKNGNVYIKSGNKKKIEVVNEDSAIEFIDDFYKKISKDDYENAKYDLDILSSKEERRHYSSIYNALTMIKTGIDKVFGYTVMKKVLLFGFFFSAMFIVYSLSSIFGITRIEDSKFITAHKDYLFIENNGNDLKSYLDIEKREDISYVIPGSSSVSMTPKIDKWLQLSDFYGLISGSLTDKDLLGKDEVIYGRLPSSGNEIVLDELALDRSKRENESLKLLGLVDYEDFLGLTLVAGNKEYTVVGISSMESPCIYSYKSEFFNILGNPLESDYGETYDTAFGTHFSDYEKIKDDITIKKGRAPLNDYEVILDIANEASMEEGKTIDIKVAGTKLKVVGYYSSKKEMSEYVVNTNTYKYDVISKNQNMMIISKNKEKTLEELKNKGYNVQELYELKRSEYTRDIKDNIKNSLVLAGVLLAISFIEIYLMIRASFLSRIKEVGIYRAIGVKRSDIYKMFLGEILVITTIAGLPGMLFMSSIMNEITKISYIGSLYLMDARIMLLSLIMIYALNIFVGLLPISRTIKKTPAEILSRNDVD